jgi:CheY-like chemotaxis protein
MPASLPSLDFPRSEAFPERTAPPPRRRARAATQDWIPRDALSGRHRASPATSRPGPLADLRGLTVVAVDDDPDTLDYFAVALRAAGAVVVLASNAPDALRLIEEHAPDVVLSDIAMMGHDGYWLVGKVRALADQAVSRLPVVAATAFGREHSRERTLAAGFNDHVRKPVDPEVLCRAIARAAGR